MPVKKKKLVIVESPAKARTVGKYLGSSYIVRPSVGHIRDLPANRLGVDVENDFTPRYVIPEAKKGIVKGLRADARAAGEIILATDPDREGEAISWHILEALNVKGSIPVRRVEFHEITKEAIREAFRQPREINQNLVDAQQARRILDRLVGYKISPLLRRKITRKGLSAGRVQSVAVRLIVDREREVDAFVPREYWTIDVELDRERGSTGTVGEKVTATLHTIGERRAEIGTGAEAESLRDSLADATYAVRDVRKREVARNPSAPFTTSTLQQEASRKLGFTARRTMAVAQGLYEGKDIPKEGSVGLITYMRTDSTNLAASAVEPIRAYIGQVYSAQHVPPEPRTFRSRARNAQEAHEAIRPTSIERTPESVRRHLTTDENRLYRLIWQRTVACQMASAILDTTTIDIDAVSGSAKYGLRVSGAIVRFPGFTAVYEEGRDDDAVPRDEEGSEPVRGLPDLAVGESLRLGAIAPEQHFTQPPPRFTEASLVKALEEFGIGRPSTYAPILTTIQERGYVDRHERRLRPTELGKVVNDLLVEHFPEIVDVNFTSDMEERLDAIAQGDGAGDRPVWVQVLTDFYLPFEETLARADREMEQVELAPEITDEVCETCGRLMVIKYGRFGKFLACSGYPECRGARSIVTKIDVLCPSCGGDIIEKRTRQRRIFFSCSNWKGDDVADSCKFAAWARPAPCPTCKTAMMPAGKDDAMCPRCSPGVASAPGDDLVEEALSA
ncbi:MAG: type I DNA topoisomerase [Chloroflexota bacterium]|nr:MAG: type I DNA topoisomerase [Chloroflexota bacterium]